MFTDEGFIRRPCASDALVETLNLCFISGEYKLAFF